MYYIDTKPRYLTWLRKPAGTQYWNARLSRLFVCFWCAKSRGTNAKQVTRRLLANSHRMPSLYNRFFPEGIPKKLMQWWNTVIDFDSRMFSSRKRHKNASNTFDRCLWISSKARAKEGPCFAVFCSWCLYDSPQHFPLTCNRSFSELSYPWSQVWKLNVEQ